MALTSIWCCGLQRSVTRVTDSGERIVAIVCSELDTPAGVCRLKMRAFRDGWVSVLQWHADGRPIDTPAPRCALACGGIVK